MKVMEADGKGEAKTNLVEIQKQIEVAAKAVNHSAMAMRHNAEKKTREEVTNRERELLRGAKERWKEVFSENKQDTHQPDIL